MRVRQVIGASEHRSSTRVEAAQRAASVIRVNGAELVVSAGKFRIR